MKHNDAPCASAPEVGRRLQAWTRRYAQNRRGMLSFANLGLYLMLMAPMVILPKLGAALRESGHETVTKALIVAWTAYAPVFLVAICLLAFPRTGNRLQSWLERHLGSKAGRVTLQPRVDPCTSKKVAVAVMGMFALCVVASVVAGLLGMVPVAYMQPVSAAYCVPFLVFVYWWLRPLHGPFMLLWPLLYGVHAALLLMGAPIYFEEPWTALNLLLPIFGYGFLASLASFVYSKIALTKARRLAAAGGE